MPKLLPPPRKAQKRSGDDSRLMFATVPFARTTYCQNELCVQPGSGEKVAYLKVLDVVDGPPVSS